MNKKTQSNIMLIITTLIWGSAFIAQKGGAAIGPFTFTGIRCILGGITVLPLLLYTKRTKKKKNDSTRTAAEIAFSKRQVWIGGLSCGVAMFIGNCLQQYGVIHTTVGKAGFITSLYAIIVPLILFFFGKKIRPVIWFCAVISTLGLYLLCMAGGSLSLSTGDLFVLGCTIFYALQIIFIDHFTAYADPVSLAFIQAFSSGIFSLIMMVFFEHPTLEAIMSCKMALFYTGVFSSGIAFTLQMLGQKNADPTQASLILCLESVFSAILGAIILGESMSGKQIFGSSLIFIAVVLSQVPLPKLNFSKKTSESNKVSTCTDSVNYRK